MGELSYEEECLAEIGRLRAILRRSKEKLELYRAAHTGEYVGGTEYSVLMRQIDDALNTSK
jgi:hypothetical protein